MNGFLTHPLLEEVGVVHGFGTIAAQEPAELRRPQQVHGTRVAIVNRQNASDLGEADAVFSTLPGVRVGVVTADCVPVLISDATGHTVAAVHAGWRGLAAGVIEETLHALSSCGIDVKMLRAVIGPHIGPCCYEVDFPVLDAMRKRFSNWQAAVTPRAAVRLDDPRYVGSAQLDLGLLARQELLHFGLIAEQIAQLANSCTACDAKRFYSYRRDGAGSGRLVHFIQVANEA